MRLKLFSHKAGFTIIEILATVAIIAILIGLLIPALNLVREKADQLKQKAQFHSIGIALEAYKSEIGFDDYPDSDRSDSETPLSQYGGAQRLAEALVGRDGFGVHQDTLFRADGNDDADIPLYKPDVDTWIDSLPLTLQEKADEKADNIAARKGPYLELETANAVKMENLYNKSYPGFVLSDMLGLVLADKFGLVKNLGTGKKTGMPILYYKARTWNTGHAWPPQAKEFPGDMDRNTNIYEYEDNGLIVDWAPPWDTSLTHPMSGDKLGIHNKIFYDATLNPNFTLPPRPYRSESFILLSAGPDGLYGTPDDIYNFETE